MDIKTISEFLMKPLLSFKENYENGSMYFKYFYLPRNGTESSIHTAITKNQNITIVGNPGQGKTSLVHFLFEKYKEDKYSNQIFPIILDYRDIAPRKPEALIVKFIKIMREYFSIIERPTSITEKTNIENCEEHLGLIKDHLRKIPKKFLSKKIVIFLDDLDYAENEYVKILNEYFLSFASSDKCLIVLSVRPPLLRNIQKHSQMRQYYHINPREVFIPDGDLKSLIKNRLKTIIEERKEDRFFPNFLQIFKKKTIDDKIYQILTNEGVWEKDSEKILLELPFEDAFYTDLNDITSTNIRIIEEIFPKILMYELGNNKPSFNEDFIGAFIKLFSSTEHILLDLVTNRTKNSIKSKNGNAKLQVILEYFYEGNRVINDSFYSFAESFGIDKHTADWAIEELESDRCSLIVPDYIYSISPKLIDYNTYDICKKGIMYIEEILTREEYYQIKRDHEKVFLKSARSAKSKLL